MVEPDSMESVPADDVAFSRLASSDDVVWRRIQDDTSVAVRNCVSSRRADAHPIPRYDGVARPAHIDSVSLVTRNDVVPDSHPGGSDECHSSRVRKRVISGTICPHEIPQDPCVGSPDLHIDAKSSVPRDEIAAGGRPVANEIRRSSTSRFLHRQRERTRFTACNAGNLIGSRREAIRPSADEVPEHGVSGSTTDPNSIKTISVDNQSSDCVRGGGDDETRSRLRIGDAPQLDQKRCVRTVRSGVRRRSWLGVAVDRDAPVIDEWR